MPMLYNGLTADQMLAFIGRHSQQVNVCCTKGGNAWTVSVTGNNGILSAYTGGTLFRATMEAFKPYTSLAEKDAECARAKLNRLVKIREEMGIG